MKKTIAILLVMVTTFTLAALPVSAASDEKMNCDICGRVLYEFYRDVIEYDHLQMESCMEYFEPHFHSLYRTYHYAMCTNQNCTRNGNALLIDISGYKDICHYGE